jgi:hypothetical protein
MRSDVSWIPDALMLGWDLRYGLGKPTHSAAARMGGSPPCGNIFTKLDVTSRTAAAGFAFEHHIT